MANFIVNQTTDDGTGTQVGTLSYAIAQANQLAGDDTITLQTDVRLTGPEFLTKSAIAKHRSLTGSGFEASDRQLPQPTVCYQILS